MAASRLWQSSATLLLLLSGLMAVQALSEKVEELQRKRAASRDSVIKLEEGDFKTYFGNPSRDFTGVIFFQSSQIVESHPTLQLPELRKEFGYAAKAFQAGRGTETWFFFEALLEDSQLPFQVFQVASLPFIVRLNPDKSMLKPPVELAKTDKMTPDSMPGAYPWKAEVFVKFLETKGITPGPIDRPSFYKTPLFPLSVLVALALVALTAYRAYQSDLARKPAIYAIGAMVVFWWSVSGGMYNYMRGMPLYIRDRQGKLQFFLKGRQGSLGAEGMIMGATYVFFSLSLALLCYVLPRIPSSHVRTPLSLLFSVIAVFSIFQTFSLWQSKTGYGTVSYLF